MLPMNDDCDDCKPGGPTLLASGPLILSYIPFIFAFFVIATFVHQNIYPSLAGESGPVNPSGSSRPFSGSGWTQSRSTSKRISAITFASTIALAAVLALLILCEISNYVDPHARGLALQSTISLLLLLLIIVIPFLETYSIVFGTGNELSGIGKGRLRLAWLLQFSLWLAWLMAFWWSGEYLLGRGADAEVSAEAPTTQSIGEASLRRIGVIGISVMSLLSGFASVSSPWQAFFAHTRTVTEATLNRRAAGLQSAQDMLATKRSRLRTLERKISESATESFFQKAIGSIRGNPDSTERQTLLVEIKGLEDMCSSLSSSLSTIQSRYNQQHASKTFHGRITYAFGAAFSTFCLFRIGSTALTFTRRSLFHFFNTHHYNNNNYNDNPAAAALSSQLSSSSSSTITHPQIIKPFTTRDPVDSTLALLALHYDPHLDHALWARAISFLLSGIILFASFTSVMQTFHLFARFAPRVLKYLQANLPLVVAQVCGTYVIAATLVLRAMVPRWVVGEGGGGVGAHGRGGGGGFGNNTGGDGFMGLGGGVGRMGWVDGWVERWFLVGVVVTVLGIWVGRQVGSTSGGGGSGSGIRGQQVDEDDFDFDDVGGGVEMGKMS